MFRFIAHFSKWTLIPSNSARILYKFAAQLWKDYSLSRVHKGYKSLVHVYISLLMKSFSLYLIRLRLV